MLRGVAYGNLYLTEKADGADFTQDDEDAVVMLASQAAVAIENARLYEAVDALVGAARVAERGDERARRPSSSSPAPAPDRRHRVQELIGARRAVTIVLPHARTALRIEAAAGDGAGGYVGMFLPPRSKTARVLERKRSERVDSIIDDPEIDQESARRLDVSTALYVPLVVRDEAIGVISAHDKVGADPRFSARRPPPRRDVRRARGARRRPLAACRARRAPAGREAQELERRRLARELHDETGQALTSILLGLRAVEEAHDGDDLRRGR